MSDTTVPPSAPESEPPTQEIFVPGTDGLPETGVLSTASGAPPWSAAGADDAWPQKGPRKGIRMSFATVTLLGLLIAAGGIWGGAALQRSQGSSSGSSSLSSLASLFRGARGTTGTGRGTAPGGGFGAAATGTVTEVSGSTLYVTNSSGDLVKVTVSPTTPVNRNAKSSLAGLQVGDTVVVEGTKQSNGSVSATSVSATASGVTSGGFGGFGG